MKLVDIGMLFNKNKNFKGFSKIFLGFFVAWFSFISLALPISALALDNGGTPLGAGAPAIGSTYDPNTGLFNTGGQLQGVNPTTGTITSVGNPAAAATNPGAYGAGTPAIGVGDVAEQSIASLATCSIGAILGRLIGSLIGILINQLMSFLGNFVLKKVIGPASDLLRCLEHFTVLCTIDSHSVDQLSYLNAKTTGYTDFSISGLIRFALSGVSMDSIMFCIVNEILTYITQATVNWINSGFNGNPVFIQNPGALLQTVADQEANSFIMNLNQGVSQNGGGGLGVVGQDGRIQVYPGVADNVVRGLVGSYSSNINQFAAQRPTYLPQTATGLNSYLNGSSYPNQPSRMLMEMPMYGSWYQQQMYMAAMQAQIAAAQENQRLRMQYNNGLNVPINCAPGHLRPDGTCDNQGIMDTYSGHILASNLQNRDMMPYLRVSLAKDFDSIVTALVNQLIKIAVTSISKKTGLSPSTVYSAGASINNQALYGSGSTNNGLGAPVTNTPNGPSYNLDYAPTP